MIRPKADDDYWEDDRVFYGFGSVHDLRDDEGSTPRLHAKAPRHALG